MQAFAGESLSSRGQRTSSQTTNINGDFVRNLLKDAKSRENVRGRKLPIYSRNNVEAKTINRQITQSTNAVNEQLRRRQVEAAESLLYIAQKARELDQQTIGSQEYIARHEAILSEMRDRATRLVSSAREVMKIDRQLEITNEFRNNLASYGYLARSTISQDQVELLSQAEAELEKAMTIRTGQFANVLTQIGLLEKWIEREETKTNTNESLSKLASILENMSPNKINIGENETLAKDIKGQVAKIMEMSKSVIGGPELIRKALSSTKQDREGYENQLYANLSKTKRDVEIDIGARMVSKETLAKEALTRLSKTVATAGAVLGFETGRFETAEQVMASLKAEAPGIEATIAALIAKRKISRREILDDTTEIMDQVSIAKERINAIIYDKTGTNDKTIEVTRLRRKRITEKVYEATISVLDASISKSETKIDKEIDKALETLNRLEGKRRNKVKTAQNIKDAGQNLKDVLKQITNDIAYDSARKMNRLSLMEEARSQRLNAEMEAIATEAASLMVLNDNVKEAEQSGTNVDNLVRALDSVGSSEGTKQTVEESQKAEEIIHEHFEPVDWSVSDAKNLLQEAVKKLSSFKTGSSSQDISIDKANSEATSGFDQFARETADAEVKMAQNLEKLEKEHVSASEQIKDALEEEIDEQNELLHQNRNVGNKELALANIEKQRLTEEKDAIENERQTLANQIKDFQKRVDDLKDKSTKRKVDYTESIRKAEENLVDRTNRLKEVNEHYDKVSNDLIEAESELVITKAQRDLNQRMLLEAKQANNDLTYELRETRESLEVSLNETKASYETRLKDSQDQRDELERKYNKVLSKLSIKVDEVNSLTTLKEQHEIQVLDLTEELESLRKAKEEEEKRLEKENETSSTKLANIKKQIEDVITERQTANTKLEETKNDLERTTSELEEASLKNESLKTQLNDVNRENEELVGSLEKSRELERLALAREQEVLAKTLELEQQLKDKEEERRKIERDAYETSETLKRNITKLSQSESENGDLREKIDGLNSSIEDYRRILRETKGFTNEIRGNMATRLYKMEMERKESIANQAKKDAIILETQRQIEESNNKIQEIELLRQQSEDNLTSLRLAKQNSDLLANQSLEELTSIKNVLDKVRVENEDLRNEVEQVKTKTKQTENNLKKKDQQIKRVENERKRFEEMVQTRTKQLDKMKDSQVKRVEKMRDRIKQTDEQTKQLKDELAIAEKSSQSNLREIGIVRKQLRDLMEETRQETERELAKMEQKDDDLKRLNEEIELYKTKEIETIDRMSVVLSEKETLKSELEAYTQEVLTKEQEAKRLLDEAKKQLDEEKFLSEKRREDLETERLQREQAEQKLNRLDQDLTAAKDKQRDLENEIDSAKKLTDDMISKVTQSNEDYKVLQESLKGHEEYRVNMENQMEQMIIKRDDLENTLSEAEKDRQKLEQTLATVEARITGLLVTNEDEIDKRNLELEGLRSLLDEKDKNVATLRSMIEISGQDYAAVSTALTASRREEAKLTLEIEEALNNNREASQRLTETEQKINGLEKDYTTSKNLATTLQNELDESKRKTGELETNLELSNQENQQLSKELEESKIKRSDLTKDLVKSEAESEEHKQKIKDLKETIDELRQREDEQRQKAVDTGDQLATTLKDLSDATNERQTLAENLATTKTEREQLRLLVQQNEKRTKALINQKNKTDQEVKLLKQQITSGQTKENEALNQALLNQKQLQKLLDEANSAKTDTFADLQNSNDKINDLDNRLKQRDDQVEKANKAADELRTQLSNNQTALDESQNNVETLTTSLSETQEKLQQLNSVNTTLTTKLSQAEKDVTNSKQRQKDLLDNVKTLRATKVLLETESKEAARLLSETTTSLQEALSKTKTDKDARRKDIERIVQEYRQLQIRVPMFVTEALKDEQLTITSDTHLTILRDFDKAKNVKIIEDTLLNLGLADKEANIKAKQIVSLDPSSGRTELNRIMNEYNETKKDSSSRQILKDTIRTSSVLTENEKALLTKRADEAKGSELQAISKSVSEQIERTQEQVSLSLLKSAFLLIGEKEVPTNEELLAMVKDPDSVKTMFAAKLKNSASQFVGSASAEASSFGEILSSFSKAKQVEAATASELARQQKEQTQKDLDEANNSKEQTEALLAKSNLEIANLKSQKTALEDSLAKTTNNYEDLKRESSITQQNLNDKILEEQNLKQQLNDANDDIKAKEQQLLERQNDLDTVNKTSKNLEKDLKSTEQTRDRLEGVVKQLEDAILEGTKNLRIAEEEDSSVNPTLRRTHALIAKNVELNEQLNSRKGSLKQIGTRYQTLNASYKQNLIESKRVNNDLIKLKQESKEILEAKNKLQTELGDKLQTVTNERNLLQKQVQDQNDQVENLKQSVSQKENDLQIAKQNEEAYKNNLTRVNTESIELQQNNTLLEQTLNEKTNTLLNSEQKNKTLNDLLTETKKRADKVVKAKDILDLAESSENNLTLADALDQLAEALGSKSNVGQQIKDREERQKQVFDEQVNVLKTHISQRYIEQVASLATSVDQPEVVLEKSQNRYNFVLSATNDNDLALSEALKVANVEVENQRIAKRESIAKELREASEQTQRVLKESEEQIKETYLEQLDLLLEPIDDDESKNRVRQVFAKVQEQLANDKNLTIRQNYQRAFSLARNEVNLIRNEKQQRQEIQKNESVLALRQSLLNQEPGVTNEVAIAFDKEYASSKDSALAALAATSVINEYRTQATIYDIQQKAYKPDVAKYIYDFTLNETKDPRKALFAMQEEIVKQAKDHANEKKDERYIQAMRDQAIWELRYQDNIDKDEAITSYDREYDNNDELETIEYRVNRATQAMYENIRQQKRIKDLSETNSGLDQLVDKYSNNEDMVRLIKDTFANTSGNYKDKLSAVSLAVASRVVDNDAARNKYEIERGQESITLAKEMISKMYAADWFKDKDQTLVQKIGSLIRSVENERPKDVSYLRDLNELTANIHSLFGEYQRFLTWLFDSQNTSLQSLGQELQNQASSIQAVKANAMVDQIDTLGLALGLNNEGLVYFKNQAYARVVSSVNETEEQFYRRQRLTYIEELFGYYTEHILKNAVNRNNGILGSTAQSINRQAAAQLKELFERARS